MEIIFHSHANKTHFHKKVFCTWPHFESEGFWNSKVAYYTSGINGCDRVGRPVFDRGWVT